MKKIKKFKIQINNKHKKFNKIKIRIKIKQKLLIN